MKKLSINLFGVFEVRIDGVPIRMPTRRVGLIMALLALNPDKALSRSYLAALIWPEQQDAQARSSLRQAIFRLRSALGADHSGAIETTSGWLRLRREAIELDIDALEGDVTPQTEAPSGLPLDGLSGFRPGDRGTSGNGARRHQATARRVARLGHQDRLRSPAISGLGTSRAPASGD